MNKNWNKKKQHEEYLWLGFFASPRALGIVQSVDKVPDPTATSLAAAVVLISDCEMRKIESKNGKNYLIDCKIQNFSIQS